MSVPASFLPWILASCMLAGVILLLLSGGSSRTEQRLSELGDPRGKPDRLLPPMGETVLSKNLRERLQKEKKKQDIRDRLLQAGFYGKHAVQWLTAIRTLSVLLPLLLGWLVSLFTDIPPGQTLFLGAVVGAVGMLAPSFILDAKKRARQLRIRRSLPDALDILNVCLEGGMSLAGAFSKAAQELITAHRELALEFAIIDRETRMGRTIGESVRAFADRYDLEELRSMASVIVQAERYGSSVVDAMEVFSGTMRKKRVLQAETKAQQAVIKIIFPTLLCIFPSLFIIIMGPAAIRIMETFREINGR
jgi:tight adherence protein C